MAASVTTFPLTGPINLDVELGYGSILVTARDGLAEATVRLTPRDAKSDVLDRVTVELEGSTLRVGGARRGLTDIIGGWRRDRAGLDVTLEVPSGTAIKMSTAGADINLTGRYGGVDVATGAASIRLDTVTGNLRLRYGHAEAWIGTVTGSVQLRSGSGSAHFGEIGGELECMFGNGALDAELVRGDMRSRAGSGSARVGAAYGNVDVALGSGPISIGLPTGASARIDVTSGSGQVHSDLPVDRAPTAGTQSTDVRARTGKGDIRLLRATAA